uniref:EGF-like domain-containing protein n=1 Tax=Clytia hemisphaerica TaxID=252671 RepID=A0A7M5UEF9_9CNID
MGRQRYFIIMWASLTILVHTDGNLWEPTNITRLDEQNGRTVSIKLHTFKKWRVGALARAWLSPPVSGDGMSKTHCAHNCLDDGRCVTFIFKNNMCRIYTTVPRATPTIGMDSIHWDMYEISNPCTENQNLCEHGSICVPDRLTKTYECINCLPPFTGNHCNETTDVTMVHNEILHDDILFGRNKSCAALYYHFDVPAGNQIQNIFPWRDQRKITVLCNSQYMVASNAASYAANVRELHAEDFADGLDISISFFRAHTSFLQEIDKVIPIDRYIFTCDRMSDGVWYEFTTSRVNAFDRYETVDYFTAKTDKRPQQDLMLFYASIPGVQLNCPNGTTSDPNIDPEERPFKNLVLDSDQINGPKFTYTNQSKQCFGNEGDVRLFKLRILN